MMHCAGNFEAELDRIYENVRAEYKYSIRLEDFADLVDLTNLAGPRNLKKYAKRNTQKTGRQKDRERSQSTERI